jgi:hypothetical protein
MYVIDTLLVFNTFWPFSVMIVFDGCRIPATRPAFVMTQTSSTLVRKFCKSVQRLDSQTHLVVVLLLLLRIGGVVLGRRLGVQGAQLCVVRQVEVLG